MQKRTTIVIVMGFPLFLLLALTAVGLGASHQVVALQPESARNAQDSAVLTGTLPLTKTEAFTVHLPFGLQGCLTGFVDDFSDPSSGWYSWPWPDECNYQDGVYRVADSSGTLPFLGATHGEGIPNDFTMRTEAWSDTGEGAFGLFFGIKELRNQDELYWDSWYAFVIEPASQGYWLDRFRAFGSDHSTLFYDTSPAIIQSAGAHQQLEVQRQGGAINLIINGVKVSTVDTHWTAPFEDKRAAGVGIQTTLPTLHAPPTAFFDNFEVITSDCISPPAADTTGQYGH